MTNIRIREIIETDIENGFLETLDRLRKASDLDKEVAKDILKKIISNPDHIIHVAEDNGKCRILYIHRSECPLGHAGFRTQQASN